MNKPLNGKQFDVQMNTIKPEIMNTINQGGEVRLSGRNDGSMKVQLIPKIITSKPAQLK